MGVHALISGYSRLDQSPVFLNLKRSFPLKFSKLAGCPSEQMILKRELGMVIELHTLGLVLTPTGLRRKLIQHKWRIEGFYRNESFYGKIQIVSCSGLRDYSLSFLR